MRAVTRLTWLVLHPASLAVSAMLWPLVRRAAMRSCMALSEEHAARFIAGEIDLAEFVAPRPR